MEWIYGRHPVLEALRAGKRKLHKLWIAEGVSGEGIDDIVDLARKRGFGFDRVPRMRLDQTVRGHHQGVAAQVSDPSYVTLDTFLHDSKNRKKMFVLGLDEIQDPQNVGAILRSAGFFGVDAVLIPRFRSAPVTDVAQRASAGALEHLTLIEVKNLAEAVLDLQREGFQVYGADMAGEPVWKVPRNDRQALILGNEGDGLRRLVRERCDKLIGIPGRGRVKSLNVGAAGTALMYDLCARSSS